jgi:AbrB family looped-hinge helix DNA binding protein
MTKITSKGQVTIPKRVRDAAGLKPGTDATVECANGGAVVKPTGKSVKSEYRKRLESVRGTFKSRLSTDEIMALLRGD